MADNTKYIDPTANLAQGRKLITETEYAFSRYFDKNIAPEVDRIMAKYDKKVDNVYRHAQTSSYTSSVIGAPIAGVTSLSAAQKQEISDAANSFTDELNKLCDDGTDLGKDIALFADAYRVSMIKAVGKTKYYQECAKAKCDLANLAVVQRLEQLKDEHLARKYEASNSLEYIINQGFRDSFVNKILEAQQSDPVRDDLRKSADKQYNANAAERLVAGAVSTTVDAAATGGFGFGHSLASRLAVGGILTLDLGCKAFASDSKPAKPGDVDVSVALFGTPDTLRQCREDSKDPKKVRPQQSDFLPLFQTIKPNNLPAHRTPFSPHAATNLTNQLNREVQGDGQKLMVMMNGSLEAWGVKMNDKRPVPKWITDSHASEENLCKRASYFLGVAIAMKDSGAKEITINGKKFTRVEVFQRAYDYGRAANEMHARKVQAMGEEQERNRAAAEAQQRQAQAAQPQQQAQPQMMMPTQQNMSGWGPLMNRLGLGDIGDLSGNLGYIFAMLPDMLVNMFTGRSNVNFKSALLPVGALFMSTFFKNPILKMLLWAFAATSLLNKAGHRVLREAGVNSNSQGTGGTRKPFYRSYADEPLNSRIQHPVMRGNTLVFDIDGMPTIATIDDTTADAYYKKKIPLNTLANAVLQKYDAQQSAAEGQYAAQQEQQQQANSVALR